MSKGMKNKSETKQSSSNAVEIPLGNGQIFLEQHEVPKEAIENILSSLKLGHVLKASEVCKVWKDIIRNPIFWRKYYEIHKALNTTWSDVHDHVEDRPDEWAVHYAVLKHDVFKKNLLVNPFGLNGFEGWKVVSGGNENRTYFFTHFDWSDPHKTGWKIVDVKDTLVNGLPAGLGPSTCFATDEYSCSKEQTIDLYSFGFTPAVMRALIPFTIQWGSYVGTPADHGGFHDMHIRLLADKSMEQLSYSNLPSMSHSSNLPLGSPFTYCGGSYTVRGRDSYEIVDKLRYIYFYHGGMDSENGHDGYNGPHIYCPSVKINLGYTTS